MAGVQFRLPPNAIFFNTKELEDATSKAERQVLSKFGAYTRRDAKRSMRRRKKGPSEPGKPPRVVTGLLKNFLFFSYDKFEQSVVVGPARLTGFKKAGEALPALEYGSTAVESRPFMTPAFGRQLDELMPDLWKDAIR